MTIIALGLTTAVAYGASDFFGGVASRRSDASLAVVALLKVTTLAVFMAGMPLASGMPNVAAMAWGGLSGLALALGYIAYFRGLAVGRMGIVATVTAVWSAIVPLAVGLALGERPSPLTWTGIGLIVLAIVLITYTRASAAQAVTAPSAPVVQAGPQCLIHCAGAALPADQPLPRAATVPAVFTPSQPIFPLGVLEATLAGIMFATFFVALDRASAANDGQALAWPLLASAMSAAILVGMVAVFRRVQWWAALRQAPVIVAAGVLYAVGSWTFILAVSRGWISIIAVIAALSPAPTMLLAKLLLAESLSARQLSGVLLALAGIALVTAGLGQ